jgi:hypothetical protein
MASVARTIKMIHEMPMGPDSSSSESLTISSCGTETAHWSASITNCTLRFKGGPSLDPSGYDAGKKIKGRKRHIQVDTLGLLSNVVAHPADVAALSPRRPI